MKLARHFFLLTLVFFLLGGSAQAAGRVEFILDVSGSMNGLAGGEKKIDAAKQAITAAVREIPEGSMVAFRLYGHRIPNEKKAESCRDSELVIPFGPIDKTKFLATLNRATPLGQTPLAFSLEEASKDFGAIGDEEAAIILVSDGAESCGGDPVAVAKELAAKGFKLKIHTIGFDVDPATRAQLQAISTATGGQYLDAHNTSALSDSLQQLTQKSLVIQKEKSVYGQEIRGGDSYETAVPLPPGRLFRLDHHQKINDYDYFYVDLKGGQKLVATIQTGEKGVEISQDGKSRENTNPYAGIQIHNSDRQKIAGDVIIGSANAKKTVSTPIAGPQGGRYFILVGNNYDSQNKDNPFQVDVVDLFDAGSQQDAGDNEASALELPLGSYKNYLSPHDSVDMFRIKTEKGVKYIFRARPSNEKVRLKITLKDSDGVQLAQAEAPNDGAAVKIEDFVAPTEGDLFVKVAGLYSPVPETDYSLSMLKEANQPTPPVVTQGPANEAPTPPPPPPAKAPPSSPQILGDHNPPYLGVDTIAELQLLFSGMPLWERIKWYLLYGGTPLVIGWVIGMIWGYVKGRKTGRKKALAEQNAKREK